MDTPLGNIEKTNNEFQFISFKDRYDRVCSIQQSSLADYEPPGSSAIWLGPTLLNIARMHLDLKQVKALICVLEQWVKNGKFNAD